MGGTFIGISRPNLHPKRGHMDCRCTDGWLINAESGTLFGNGKLGDDTAGGYKQGDRVGMLLDLNNGSLRFFKNGVQHGSSYAAGSVKGPVVAAVVQECGCCRMPKCNGQQERSAASKAG
jgi:hypothetical protein